MRGRLALMRDGLGVLVRRRRASGETDRDRGRYRPDYDDRPDGPGYDLCVHHVSGLLP